ncbi:Ku protein [Dietzia sp. UCD-THP]|uniref:non-homologous end joining protein Ku n=1 Tax=Dietzia sp. UCD-THP TaxID=1292020 RepID=UPI0021105D61|nr:Ku protein [Dietzia sp. UCD-THP]
MNRGYRRPAAARLFLSHTPHGVRIRYRKVRDDNGEEVEFSDIAKAYESEDGEMVILTKEDLASLPVKQPREIQVTEFVPADQLDPVAFDNAYFLGPASRSNRAYVLMREALESTDRQAICTFTLRNRTRLCALRVYKDILMLQTLLWPDEIRPAILEGLDNEAKVRPQEVKMAAWQIGLVATAGSASWCAISQHRGHRIAAPGVPTGPIGQRRR